jgi:hypothetical protein
VRGRAEQAAFTRASADRLFVWGGAVDATTARSRALLPLQLLRDTRAISAVTAGYLCVGVVMRDAIDGARQRVLMLQLNAACEVTSRSVIAYTASSPCALVDIDSVDSTTSAHVSAFALGSSSVVMAIENE